MNRVLVVQSYRDAGVPAWIRRCTGSVKHWAAEAGFAYRYEGDALLERVPAWYRDKVGARMPILADLARLKWMRSLLHEGAAEVTVWLDADTLIFAPERFSWQPPARCQFGLEFWLQADAQKPGWRTYRNVHNAFCAFHRDSATLPFLIETMQTLVERVDPAHLAPQFVGPKLLTSLHNTVGFELEPRIGAVSPLLGQAVIAADEAALAGYRRGIEAELAGANLCASLAGEMDHDRLVEALLARRRL